MEAVLKTARARALGGSNPSPSARRWGPPGGSPARARLWRARESLPLRLCVASRARQGKQREVRGEREGTYQRAEAFYSTLGYEQSATYFRKPL